MNRRGFLTLGLRAAVLATAVSTGLGRVSLELVKPRNSFLTIDMITREALRIAHESSAFISAMNKSHAGFAGESGSTIQIRRPTKFALGA